jgi:hypothetical protein
LGREWSDVAVRVGLGLLQKQVTQREGSEAQATGFQEVTS